MTDRPRIRPFADFLREHGRGRTHDVVASPSRSAVSIPRSDQPSRPSPPGPTSRILTEQRQALETARGLLVKRDARSWQPCSTSRRRPIETSIDDCRGLLGGR